MNMMMKVGKPLHSQVSDGFIGSDNVFYVSVPQLTLGLMPEGPFNNRKNIYLNVSQEKYMPDMNFPPITPEGSALNLARGVCKMPICKSVSKYFLLSGILGFILFILVH